MRIVTLVFLSVVVAVIGVGKSGFLSKYTLATSQAQDAKTQTTTGTKDKFFKLTLHTPEGTKEIECKEDQYILDAAEEAGVDMPYSCRAGSCSSCAAKLIKGSIDNSEQSYLDDSKKEQGYFLTCVGYPTADCVLETHQEEKMK